MTYRVFFFTPVTGFLQGDVSRDGQRHLILATNDQLKFLARCRRWYIDGTFKIVAKPFYQLLSIHGFLKKDDMMKQVIQATDFFFFFQKWFVKVPTQFYLKESVNSRNLILYNPNNSSI